MNVRLPWLLTGLIGLLAALAVLAPDGVAQPSPQAGTTARWTVEEPPIGILRAISGSAADDVWAVGDLGTAIHLRWDGQRWTSEKEPMDLPLPDAGLLSRWARPPIPEAISRVGDNLWVSYEDLIWRHPDSDSVLHGGWGWTGVRIGEGFKMNKPFQTILGIGGSGSDDAWVVGSAGLISHWDGSRWSRQESQIGESLDAVWAPNAGEAWAVGEAGEILHFRR